MSDKSKDIKKKGKENKNGKSGVFDLSKIDDIAKGDIRADKQKRGIVDRGTLRMKDVIAPDMIKNEVNHIEIGKRHLRTIIVTGFPRTAHIGWLNRLYSHSANIDISSFIEPLQTDKVIKNLNKKIAQYLSTQRMDSMKGKVMDPDLEVALGDAQELREALAKGTEKLFYHSIYINIAGKDTDELDLITDEIETLCGSMGMMTRHAMYQQEQGFRTCLPIADDRLHFKRNFTSSSLATCLPIVSAELTNTNGTPILYGLNMVNGSLVLFDRFALSNYNSLVLATSGSGKSYFVKLETIRYMGLGTNVIIIDPQGEYERIAKALGGEYIKLSAGSEDRINPMQLDQIEEEEEGQNFLTQKILDIVSIVEVMVERDLNAREKKILMDCTAETYRQFGITNDKRSVMKNQYYDGDLFQLESGKKKMPTLSDLENTLRSHGAKEAMDLADELEPHSSGIKSLFNGVTNVNTESNFIVFDISSMEKQLAEVAMFICLEFVWNKIKKNDNKRRLLIIDEAWMLMKNKQSSDYIVRVAKTARKFNAGMSIISQQVRDFLQNGGEAILGNAEMKVLLKQSSSDIESVAQIFHLSKAEQEILRISQPGEALIFAGNNHTAVKVISHPFEHILADTNPAELEKIKDLLK